MRKWWKRLAVFALVAAALTYGAGLLKDHNLLEENLLRLHVVANSDTQADQSVKLRVRDAVLNVLSDAMGAMPTMEEAKAYLQTHLPEIRQAANTALKQAGSSLEAAVTLVKEAFPQRIYDTFRLPAGVYETLRITIGQGEGRNWWCVLFPTLCVPTSSAGFEAVAVSAGMPEDLSHTLSGQTPDIRFRLLDWLGEIKCWLNG